MKASITRKAFAAFALITPMILGAPAIAHADPDDPLPVSDAVVVEGAGTITPALPCFHCAINFKFTAVAAGDELGNPVGAQTFSGCEFNGTSLATDDEFGGTGSGTLSGCPASGVVTYTRTGALVQVSGKISAFGQCHDITTSALVFIPTSDPVTTFIVTGAVVLGDSSTTC